MLDGTRVKILTKNISFKQSPWDFRSNILKYTQKCFIFILKKKLQSYGACKN